MAPKNEQSLKSLAASKNASNPSQLGDPVSLKAETSDNEPTENDRPNKSSGRKSLKQIAEKNPTQLGDPVSLKAETADSEPTEHDRGALSSSKAGKDGSKL